MHLLSTEFEIAQAPVIVTIYFKEPYPSHENLKKNDWVCITTGKIVWHPDQSVSYKDCELYENFTTSAEKCIVNPPNEMLHANYFFDRYTSSDELRNMRRLSENYYELQCVVVALQYIENPDIGPDHDYDVLISSAVIKSGDGNLYAVEFYSAWRDTEHDEEVVRMPEKGLFSEGDRVTLNVKPEVLMFSEGKDPFRYLWSYTSQFLKKGWK